MKNRWHIATRAIHILIATDRERVRFVRVSHLEMEIMMVEDLFVYSKDTHPIELPEKLRVTTEPTVEQTKRVFLLR